MQLQRKRPSDASWRVIASYTANFEDVAHVAQGIWQMRFECTVYTSGTFSYELASQ